MKDEVAWERFWLKLFALYFPPVMVKKAEFHKGTHSLRAQSNFRAVTVYKNHSYWSEHINSLSLTNSILDHNPHWESSRDVSVKHQTLQDLIATYFFVSYCTRLTHSIPASRSCLCAVVLSPIPSRVTSLLPPCLYPPRLVLPGEDTSLWRTGLSITPSLNSFTAPRLFGCTYLLTCVSSAPWRHRPCLAIVSNDSINTSSENVFCRLRLQRKTVSQICTEVAELQPEPESVESVHQKKVPHKRQTDIHYLPNPAIGSVYIMGHKDYINLPLSHLCIFFSSARPFHMLFTQDFFTQNLNN